MSIEEIIKALKETVYQNECSVKYAKAHGIDYIADSIRRDIRTLRWAIALLKTHPDAQPNEPLTLEELREMDGQPVWTHSDIFPCDCGWRVIKRIVVDSDVEFTDGWSFGFDGYGKNWLAYRRPPKED